MQLKHSFRYVTFFKVNNFIFVKLKFIFAVKRNGYGRKSCCFRFRWNLA